MHPVIINASLNDDEKRALITVLKRNKKALGYKLDDLKGISPDFCMHRIKLEADSKAIIQGQRRLSPNMHDVVKK